MGRKESNQTNKQNQHPNYKSKRTPRLFRLQKHKNMGVGYKTAAITGIYLTWARAPITTCQRQNHPVYSEIGADEPMGTGALQLIYRDISNFPLHYNSSLEIYSIFTFPLATNDWCITITLWKFINLQLSHDPMTESSLQMTDVLQLLCGDLSNFSFPLNPWVMTANGWRITITLCRYIKLPLSNEPGRIAQSVTCLATDACLTADQGVASSIPVRPHTFVEIDHEMISTVILLLPLIHSRRVVVSYKRKYVHELLVNRLFKPAQEKVWLGELTVPQWP